MPWVDVSKLMAPATGSSTFDVVATNEVAPNGDGAFRTFCAPSHMSFDDPIVFPGQVGRSHLHVFFGNTGTNANSTPGSIRTTGNSTCRGGIANRSAYWVPAMIDTQTGAPVMTDGAGVYYKSGNYAPEKITPIPEGLRMIAGDPSASEPRGQWADFTYRWKCTGGPNNENDKYGSEIPNCDVGATAIMEIMFPQCWDGKNLDSPDHKSHMSYQTYQEVQRSRAEGGNYNNIVCPATHPVIIPAITFNVGYVIKVKDEPLHWRLASDAYSTSKSGGYSAHGDWFNGWMPDVSNSFAQNCVRAKKDCHSHLLGDGRAIF